MISLRFFGLSASLGCVSAILIACSSSSSDAPATRGNGVDDVKQSCEIRAAWTKRGERRCIDCLAAAPSAACDCEEFRDFAGLCVAQADAQRTEVTCTDEVSKCVTACPANDCSCAEGCYARAAACQARTAAREGCVTDVCSPYCK